MTTLDKRKKATQVLAFLTAGPARCSAVAKDIFLLTNGENTFVAPAATLKHLVSLGKIRRNGSLLALTHLGEKEVTGPSGFDDGRACQHRVLETVTVAVDGIVQPVSINVSESPLGALMRRKGGDGRPYLSDDEFAAGERLRSDYTRGQIMPRLGANWEASVSSVGRRHGNPAADLTATALAARQRVDKAIAAVGPELSGILIDICCFLKGLERVERERSWPVRSGKLLLKTALATLARHYAPPAPAKRGSTLHWGSDDYRPSIS